VDAEGDENRRLLAQAEAFASDELIVSEAARWRDASPQERLVETWRLSTMVPWFRSLWSPELRARADQPEPLPADAMALLARMKTRDLAR
jgi:hypothetical protein